MREDPLAAARGIVFGLLFGSAFWLAGYALFVAVSSAW
jgi:hypothetical protein